MAKGCVRYYIQEYIHDEGWTDLVSDIRDTEKNVQKKFNDIVDAAPNGLFRLGRLFVMDQRQANVKVLENII